MRSRVGVPHLSRNGGTPTAAKEEALDASQNEGRVEREEEEEDEEQKSPHTLR